MKLDAPTLLHPERAAATVHGASARFTFTVGLNDRNAGTLQGVAPLKELGDDAPKFLAMLDRLRYAALRELSARAPQLQLPQAAEPPPVGSDDGIPAIAPAPRVSTRKPLAIGPALVARPSGGGTREAPARGPKPPPVRKDIDTSTAASPPRLSRNMGKAPTIRKGVVARKTDPKADAPKVEEPTPTAPKKPRMGLIQLSPPRLSRAAREAAAAAAPSKAVESNSHRGDEPPPAAVVEASQPVDDQWPEAVPEPPGPDDIETAPTVAVKVEAEPEPEKPPEKPKAKSKASKSTSKKSSKSSSKKKK